MFQNLPGLDLYPESAARAQLVSGKQRWGKLNSSSYYSVFSLVAKDRSSINYEFTTSNLP